MTAPTHIALYCVSALGAALSCGVSLWLCYLHVRNRQDPTTCMYTLRVLALAPLYAFCSAIQLAIPRLAVYLVCACEVYEAVALYQFVKLLLHLFYHRAPGLGLQAGDAVPFEERHQDPEAWQAHNTEVLFEQCEPAVLCCGALTLWPSAELLRGLRYAALQYLVVRCAHSVVAVALHESPGEQGFAHSLDPGHAYFWTSSLVNLSISAALFAVFLLIALLEPVVWAHDPWLKFGSLKLVIFFCFWQTMVLSALGYAQMLPLAYFAPWNAARLIDALDSTLVCVEMAALSVYHHWIFRPDEPQRTSVLSHVLRETLEE
jgi:hypothetical protein